MNQHCQVRDAGLDTGRYLKDLPSDLGRQCQTYRSAEISHINEVTSLAPVSVNRHIFPQPHGLHERGNHAVFVSGKRPIDIPESENDRL